MTRTLTLPWLAIIPAVAALLTSCSAPAPTADSAVAPASSPAEATPEPTEMITTVTVDPSAQASGLAPSDDTAAALAAIATAEAASGGMAYAVDDADDDGTWEIDVMLSDAAVEYTISGDGNQVIGTKDEDLDSDEGAALRNATVTLTQAITAAVGSGGQPLDDAEFDDESGVWAWEVSLEGRDSDILIDPASGEVINS